MSAGILISRPVTILKRENPVDEWMVDPIVGVVVTDETLEKVEERPIGPFYLAVSLGVSGGGACLVYA